MINVKTTPLKLWRYYVKYRFLRFFLRIFAPQLSSLWLTKGHWNSSSLTSRRKS